MGNKIYTKAEREKNGSAAPENGFHPLAMTFPQMKGSSFIELCDSIREFGQHEPIVMLDGMVLDGRNRWLACHEMELKPITREFGSRQSDGDDPHAFVVSQNVTRRHLTTAQRAFVASRMATAGEGRTLSNDRVTIEQACSLMGVGAATAHRARSADYPEALVDGDSEYDSPTKNGEPLDADSANRLQAWRDLCLDGEFSINALNKFAERKDLGEIIEKSNLAAMVEGDPVAARKAWRKTAGSLLKESAPPEEPGDTRASQSSMLAVVSKSIGNVARLWTGDIAPLANELRRLADKYERRARESKDVQK